ncbi:MAG: Spy/CpxP family protein refolding chaperone [Gemmatimonadota bacterium]
MSGRTLMAIVAVAGLALPLQAQTPAGPAAGAGGPLANPAAFLLANSAPLGLANEQVVQLAELARTAEARREELRSRMSTARPDRDTPPDPALREQRRAMMDELRAVMQSERAAAIAVLDAEQQARAWELVVRARPQQPRAGPGARRPAATTTPGAGGSPCNPRMVAANLSSGRARPPQGSACSSITAGASGRMAESAAEPGVSVVSSMATP